MTQIPSAQDLKNNVDFLAYLETRCKMHNTKSHDYVYFYCPFVDHECDKLSPGFAYSLQFNRVKCYKCGTTQLDVYDFIKKLDCVSFEEAYNTLLNALSAHQIKYTAPCDLSYSNNYRPPRNPTLAHKDLTKTLQDTFASSVQTPECSLLAEFFNVPAHRMPRNIGVISAADDIIPYARRLSTYYCLVTPMYMTPTQDVIIGLNLRLLSKTADGKLCKVSADKWPSRYMNIGHVGVWTPDIQNTIIKHDSDEFIQVEGITKISGLIRRSFYNIRVMFGIGNFTPEGILAPDNDKAGQAKIAELAQHHELCVLSYIPEDCPLEDAQCFDTVLYTHFTKEVVAEAVLAHAGDTYNVNNPYIFNLFVPLLIRIAMQDTDIAQQMEQKIGRGFVGVKRNKLSAQNIAVYDRIKKYYDIYAKHFDAGISNVPPSLVQYWHKKDRALVLYNVVPRITEYEYINILNGTIRSGTITIIGGRTGTGKTTITVSIARDLAQQGMRVCYISLEQDVKTLRDRLTHYGQNVVDNVLFFADLPCTEMLGTFLLHIKMLGYSAIFVDHLRSLIKNDIETDILSFLQKLAIKYDLMIFIAAHSVKNAIVNARSKNFTIDKTQLFGGSDVINEAACILIIQEFTQDGKPLQHLDVQKDRHSNDIIRLGDSTLPILPTIIPYIHNQLTGCVDFITYIPQDTEEK